MNKNRQYLFLLIILSLLTSPVVIPDSWAFTKENISSRLSSITAGISKKRFLRSHPKSKARTYRSNQNEDWLTFDDWEDPKRQNMITFYFKNNKLVSWTLNDRSEVVDEYLGEFCSQTFIQSFPKIYSALRKALRKIPGDVFRSITDRSRPVLFTEYHTTGTGRFANSSEIIATEDDAPTFEKGLTIIKLSTDLESASDTQAIEGVILHELAHRYLEHAQKPLQTCDLEREANRLVAQWGFGNEYREASKTFGHKKEDGEAPCRD